MKIAISCIQEKKEGPMDSRFGRAPYFFFIQSDGTSGYFKPNTQNKQAVQGAGIQAAQSILKEEAKVLITGHCGPKAFRVLKEGGVRVYTAGSAELKVEEALRLFSEEKLEELNSADVEGHWV